MYALGRTVRRGVQLNARFGEAACRVTTSAACEATVASSAAPSQKAAVSREFQVNQVVPSMQEPLWLVNLELQWLVNL